MSHIRRLTFLLPPLLQDTYVRFRNSPVRLFDPRHLWRGDDCVFYNEPPARSLADDDGPAGGHCDADRDSSRAGVGSSALAAVRSVYRRRGAGQSWAVVYVEPCLLYTS